MYNEIKHCRLSKSSELIEILSLGNQYLTGVFPSSIEQEVGQGPLELVKMMIESDLKREK